MSCITYLHNDPFDSGGTKFISGTTCDGEAEVWNLSFGESACLESELPMIICDGLTISGDCNSDCICWPRGSGAFSDNQGSVLDLSYDANLNRVYVVGNFNSYSGVPVQYFTAISSSTGGLVGGNFSTTLFNFACQDVKVQSDSKVLVGGLFTTFSSSSQNALVRLNTNGTRDNTFNIGTGFNSDVQIITIDTNNKILVGGRFSQFNGQTKSGLVRLNQDGTLDPTFSGLTTGFTDGADGFVLTYEIVEWNDKYYVSGDFGSYEGVPCTDIVRLNQDGSLDTSFSPVSAFTSGRIVALGVQSDGKPIVASTNAGIFRLNLDGSIDTTFTAGATGLVEIQTIEVLPDDKILLGGRVGGTAKLIIKYNVDGSLDTSFTSPLMVCLNQPTRGLNSIVLFGECILVGGQWTSVDGFIGQAIAKLFSDGSLNMCNPIAVTPTPTPTNTRTPTPTITPTQTQTPTQTIGLTPTQTSSPTPTPTQTLGIEIFTHGTVFATCSDFCNANYQIDVSTPATANYATLTFGDTIFGQGGVAGFVAYAATSTDTSTGTFRIAEIDSSGEIIDILVCSGGSCVPL